jgi:hypothetical protein
LREFPHRSADQLCRQIMNGAPAVLAARAEGTFSGGEHWIAMYRMAQEHGEDLLRRHYEEYGRAEPGPTLLLDPFPGAPA